MSPAQVTCPVCARRVPAYVGTETPRVHWQSGERCAGGGRDPESAAARTSAAKAAGGRRGGRAKSEAKAAAARANGEQGGRPPKHRYHEIFAALPSPADIKDPLELPGWFMRAIAITTAETLQGRGQRDYNQELRASARLAAELIPRERLRQAEEAVRSTTKKSKRKRGAGAGPKLTKAPPPSQSRPVR